MDGSLVSPLLQIHRPKPIGNKADESELEEPEDEEFLSNESEAEELIGSKSVESDSVESEVDELEPRKLIGHECEYCLKVGDHFTQLCPYKYYVPKNAIVSTRCVVLCNRCGCHFRDSCCSSCGRSDGCAVLMDCLNCGKKGEHMTYMCPSRKLNPVCSQTIKDGGVVSPPLQIHRPKPIGSKADESELEELEDEEFLSNESEAEELIGSKAVEYDSVELEVDELEPRKLIVLMDCLNCGKKGEHMTYMCPSRKLNPVCSQTIKDGGVVSPPLQIHQPKPIKSKNDESENDESEIDESETDESEIDESETDESENLIGHECEYCLKVGDHFTILCPYRYHVPKNAIVSERCVVLCNCCGCHFKDSYCSSCGGSNGCAVIMNCLHCGNYGEHMTYMCPSHERSPDLYFL